MTRSTLLGYPGASRGVHGVRATGPNVTLPTTSQSHASDLDVLEAMDLRLVAESWIRGASPDGWLISPPEYWDRARMGLVLSGRGHLLHRGEMPGRGLLAANRDSPTTDPG